MSDFILLVDDDPRLVGALQIRLEACGYNVRTASNGEEGLASARLIEPQAIVLDVNMPKIDGLEVCRLLRAEERFATTPIIVMSAITHEESQKAALMAGADQFIGKPYQAKQAMAAIQTAIANRGTRGRPRAA